MATPVCRVCLVGDVKRFYIEDDHMLLVYTNLTSTQLKTAQRPQGVCYLCLSLLQKCCRFSEMARRSEQILTDLFDQGIVVSDEMSMPELDLGLQPTLSVAPMQSMSIDASKKLDEVDLAIKNDPHVETESIPEDNHIKEESTISNDLTETIAITDNTTNESDPLFGNDTSSDNKYIKFEIEIQEDFDNVKKELNNETGGNATFHNEHFVENTEHKIFEITISEENEYATPEILVNKDIGSQNTNQELYNCNICDKTFTRKNLASHKKTHSTNKTHICKLCNKRFTCYTYLVRHMQTHTTEKKYKCEFCNKSFSLLCYLNIHMSTHRNDRPYSCKYCGKSFTAKSNLCNHLRTHTEKPYTCHYCKKGFSHPHQLKRHLATKTGEQQMVCRHCKESFTRRCILIAHLKTHSEKNLTCNLCNKSYGSLDSLRKHALAHAKDNPFKCKDCDKSFVEKACFIKHMRTHNKIYK